VLGEYTFASLLNFNTFPTVLALLGKSDAPTSVAGSLAALILGSVLLLLLGLVGRRRRTSRGA
jgi:putative spermidine/putrescine transport system permease protein